MTNNQKRWLLFLIALPLLAGIVFLDYAHHLVFNLLVVLIAMIGTNEMCQMLNKAGIPMQAHILAPAGGIIPLLTYLEIVSIIPGWLIAAVIFLMVSMILSIPVFTMGRTNFKKLISTASGSLLVLLYPGFFLSHIVRFSALPHSNYIIIIFILTVYLNDSNAWFIGNLFGKNSRKVFAVSPNKSLAGFGGGIIASVIVTTVSRILYPHIFSGPLYIMILLGLFAGCTTILGDLLESGIKRSSGVKDSGNIIMGRGGVLDSIDSLLLTAPVFYYFLKFAA
jgi:phosphatidate cytidylyltransferase